MGFQLIGACSGWGAQIRSCEQGPQDLLENEGTLLYPKRKASDSELSFKEALPIIHEFNLRLAKLVEKTVESGSFPIIIEGDHSSAVGTWNGIRKAHKGDLGLLWIDAHMDSHTPETTPSGAWHGMPLAALMGFGLKEMAQLIDVKPVLLPEHVVLIGVRSFEEGEKALLDRLNVKIYYMDEVKRRGFSTVFKEAIEKVSQKTFGFGVSLDIDVVDPEDAPGVGSPEPHGLRGKELLEGLKALKNPKLVGVEISEYNPARDQSQKTKQLVREILKKVIS
jgi:arginase